MFRIKSNNIYRNPLTNFRALSTSQALLAKLRLALIGQSTFAAEVYKLVRARGHQVVGVFTIPDKASREDPLATVASKDNTPVFKVKAWRKGDQALKEIIDQYMQVGAELNVLPFCSQFIPMEVINHPKHKSICYHPSILPKHRGVSAINWTLINGDEEAGFSVFWADEGLDTGPLLLQQKCKVERNDTVDSLYSRFLYPAGIQAMADAVDMVANGTAPKIDQPTEGASFEPSVRKKDLQKVDWNSGGLEIHNFIRGLDSSPGAWAVMNNEEVKLFASGLWESAKPDGQCVQIDGMDTPGLVHAGGLLLVGSDGKMVNVERLSVKGRMIPASQFGKQKSEGDALKLTDKEQEMAQALNEIWASILSLEVNASTDFFASGAGSMDVVRLVEEIKENLKVTLQNEDVFMSPVFSEFCETVIKKARGLSDKKELKYSAVNISANSLNLSFPNQLFINNNFVDSESNGSIDCINPADESVICKVQSATEKDVDTAVEMAKKAFYEGEWSKISSRDRGVLMHRLADLMEEHKEELATIESIDSGAVYTLALKTHVGMSIETWRYFAGWTDKIHGSTIPISHARPNRNLTITKREPIGVCGLITPWNYPLMMLSWKMAPCLAAGNTVVMKPSEQSPLTALKFAELSVKAGFPPGVINILPGTGIETGNAITNHPDIRKVGFTGSTITGQKVMKNAAANLKKVSLELGGKSPLVIFDDFDLDKSVRLSMGGVFFNKGENCIAAGRVFVESSIHDEFLQKVVEETKKIVVGDPLNRNTQHGPQNHLAHLEKLEKYCRAAEKEGAKLVFGGKRCDRPGYFFQPTIFSDVEDHMFIANEEAFGPIMAVSKFSSSDMDSLIKRLNSIEYGLASGIFTRDINRALNFAERIEAGSVFINTYNKTDVAAPFGGFKQSGFGKDLGEEALNEYTKVKCITVEY
ncbi:cytosolic 10-formyltetrahydrofolate dehydrogenase-like isoform X1 [Macrosteles quadrilineatus]|uniref:cytosolic 10-formyltetrahydrofolate dehydrogenase-like isoform X1 n=1 Tax=Macrosteles quadrilineatus TaxID=74068 RepID=UPI0023E0B034|nr:cytosolic 10-formyltetrahydrofolate dehydrogenase-like isoform X1 [Macrosteles quadrilineatus]